MTQGIDYRACHELAKRGASREAIKCYLGLALTKYGVGKDDSVRTSNSLMAMGERLDGECPDFGLSNKLPESVGVQKGITFESALELFDSGENEKLPLQGHSLSMEVSDTPKFKRFRGSTNRFSSLLPPSLFPGETDLRQMQVTAFWPPELFSSRRPRSAEQF
jgi:hypothetical protein